MYEPSTCHKVLVHFSSQILFKNVFAPDKYLVSYT